MSLEETKRDQRANEVVPRGDTPQAEPSEETKSQAEGVSELTMMGKKIHVFLSKSTIFDSVNIFS